MQTHILQYTDYLKDGIFGTFQFSGDPDQFCVTLSHAFPIAGPNNTFTYAPIVSVGRTYHCVRGMHKIHGKNNTLEDIETFEILGIDGHSGLLFHWLNYNSQSEGCTGLGAKRIHYDSNHDGKIDQFDDEMITSSRATFAAWMERLQGIDEFLLEVK